MNSGTTNPTSERKRVREARAPVADLFDRKPELYWLDFGVTVVLTWALVAVYFSTEAWSPMQLGAVFLAAIGVFRAGTFMHEIVYFKSGEMVAFRWAWNLLLGFPILMPWVLYRNHIEHHSRRHFPTPGDGEYLPLAATPPLETVKYLLQPVLLPPLTFLRFGIFGPLSHLSPRLREWLLTCASAAATNPYYRKRFPARHEPELIRSEWFCFAWLVLLVALTVFGPMRPVHWQMAWALLSLAFGLNWLRNLAAHGYANDGEPRSHIGQLQDSFNLTGQTWLTFWLFPAGLRYHALHHLLPGLPYHQLGRAHRRLLAGLPSDHPYHRCNHDSYFRIVGRLLHDAWKHRGQRAILRRWQAGYGY
ncbi:MAG: fatty acid desaturase [Wenzhouxiangellaceae bacterium]|nr:fatty acid desaturase [Wenzhouxiangellaceae bacterium]